MFTEILLTQDQKQRIKEIDDANCANCTNDDNDDINRDLYCYFQDGNPKNIVYNGVDLGLFSVREEVLEELENEEDEYEEDEYEENYTIDNKWSIPDVWNVNKFITSNNLKDYLIVLNPISSDVDDYDVVYSTGNSMTISRITDYHDLKLDGCETLFSEYI